MYMYELPCLNIPGEEITGFFYWARYGAILDLHLKQEFYVVKLQNTLILMFILWHFKIEIDTSLLVLVVSPNN
jgi:hypothetical protein